jgi:hypothetical protein
MQAAHISVPGEGSWRPMLRAIPVHNDAARIEYLQEKHSARISVPAVKPKWMVAPVTWFVRFRSRKEYDLDCIGLFVWDRCTGSSTVEQIIDVFAKQYVLTFHESRVAVTEYITLLIKRGILAIMIQK